MMRRLAAAWIALCFAFLPVESSAVLKAVSGSSPVANITSGTISGATITNSIGAANVIAASGISFVRAPTGTMGNNGAITLGTALDRTYAEGCWMFLPAGAVAAGVPAAASWLWVVMSSGTVGTVFNSTYTTGVPTVGVTTAFATTGPGAYTGDTTEQGITIPIAANALGAMGGLEIEAEARQNNTAGTKTSRVRFGGSAGTVVSSVAETTVTDDLHIARVFNGTTGAQNGVGRIMKGSAGIGVTAPTNPAVDTTSATSVYISSQIGTATDYQIISFVSVKLIRSA